MLDLLPPDSVDPRDKFCIMLLERLDDLSDKYFKLEQRIKELDDMNLTQKVKLLDIPPNVVSFNTLFSKNINVIIYIQKKDTDNEKDIVLELAKHFFDFYRRLTNTNTQDILTITKIKVKEYWKFEIVYQGCKSLNVLEFFHNLKFSTIENYEIQDNSNDLTKYYNNHYNNHEHMWTFMGSSDNIISDFAY